MPIVNHFVIVSGVIKYSTIDHLSSLLVISLNGCMNQHFLYDIVSWFQNVCVIAKL